MSIEMDIEELGKSSKDQCFCRKQSQDLTFQSSEPGEI
jgi:hypothetical protein